MDLKDCEIIKVMSEELNLTKTAEKLYTSQPSLTYRLNKLEEELDVVLFKRLSTGIILTKEGEYLAEYSKKFLLEYEIMKKNIKNIKDSEERKINLGISTTMAKYKLAFILQSLKEVYPQIKINIISGNSYHELPKLLKEEKIDIGILRGDVPWNEEKYIVSKEPYGIISQKLLKIEELEKIPYIQYETNTVVKSRIFLDEWSKIYLGKPFQGEIIKVNSTEASLEMIKSGIGWTVLPKIHMQNFKELNFFPMVKLNGEPFERETYLLVKREKLKDENIKKIVENILENKERYFK